MLIQWCNHFIPYCIFYNRFKNRQNTIIHIWKENLLYSVINVLNNNIKEPSNNNSFKNIPYSAYHSTSSKPTFRVDIIYSIHDIIIILHNIFAVAPVGWIEILKQHGEFEQVGRKSLQENTITQGLFVSVRNSKRAE